MRKLNTVIAALTLAVAGNVSATEITSWDFINESGFVNPSGATGSGDATPNGVLSGPAFQTLTWGNAWSNGPGGPWINGGVDNLQSTLEVDSPKSGTLITNGGQEVGTGLTHNNWVVGFKGGTLTSTDFLDGLKLVPATVTGGGDYEGEDFDQEAPEVTFEFSFFETPNFVDYAVTGGNVANNNALDGSKVCANGDLNGVGDNINGCADIFVVSSTGGVEFAVVDGNLEISNTFPLTLDGVTFEYTVKTVLSGLSLINDTACVAAGASEGCFGFVTTEESVNNLTTMFSISSEFIPIPVASPSTLAIFGLGLLGLGGLARRKTK